MKILIITHEFIPDLGGGIIVIYNYAKQLAALGHDVVVLSKRYAKAVEGEGFKHIMLPGKYNDRLYIYDFKLFLSTFDLSFFDKIILNQYPSAIVAGKFFTKEILAKCIPIIQGFEVEGVYKNDSLKGYIYNHLIQRTHKYHRRCMILCDKVVSVSAAHRDKVIKGANLEVVRDKFQIVYTGIDKDVFHNVPSDFREKNGLIGKQILVTVSRIVKQKGYDDMLKVFSKVYEQDKSYIWVVVGDGEYLSEFKNKINKAGLDESVKCLGKYPQERLKEVYSASDCFWLLSNYDECLPLVYIEAQACGVPAIGRNRGGVVETIIDKKTGFLVNTEDECCDILLNKKYKEINKAEILAFAFTFDKEKAISELIKK